MEAIDSVEALLAAAREHGVRLTATRPELDETGADFIVAHAVDGDGVPWVVKAPRRADVLERAAAERRTLEMVRSRLPVPVPEWRVFSPEVIAYPRVSGDPAAVVDLEAGGYVWRFDETAPPAAFGETLAAALAALHGIGHDAVAGAGLRVQGPAEFRQAFAERADRSREVLDVPEPVWRRWQTWLSDDSFWPEHSALIHGDLHPAHVLVDGEHRVTGLLDWTEASVADPAADFALFYATLGRDWLSGALERYRAAGGRVWPRMADHVVETWFAYPVVIADFARLTGEDAPRQFGQAMVEEKAREIEAG